MSTEHVLETARERGARWATETHKEWLAKARTIPTEWPFSECQAERIVADLLDMVTDSGWAPDLVAQLVAEAHTSARREWRHLVSVRESGIMRACGADVAFDSPRDAGGGGR